MLNSQKVAISISRKIKMNENLITIQLQIILIFLRYLDKYPFTYQMLFASSYLPNSYRESPFPFQDNSHRHEKIK